MQSDNVSWLVVVMTNITDLDLLGSIFCVYVISHPAYKSYLGPQALLSQNGNFSAQDFSVKDWGKPFLKMPF